MMAAEVIASLGLEPHPEGGHFRQTWAAPARPGERPGATTILFLLAEGERSHWHRVTDADEAWLFQAGAPLVLSMAETAAGPAREVRLGPPGEGQPQAVVPAGWWQAARGTGAWTLVGCVVSPGFTYDSFVLAPPGFEVPS